jgi:hypothetical protein
MTKTVTQAHFLFTHTATHGIQRALKDKAVMVEDAHACMPMYTKFHTLTDKVVMTEVAQSHTHITHVHTHNTHTNTTHTCACRQGGDDRGCTDTHTHTHTHTNTHTRTHTHTTHTHTQTQHTHLCRRGGDDGGEHSPRGHLVQPARL